MVQVSGVTSPLHRLEALIPVFLQNFYLGHHESLVPGYLDLTVALEAFDSAATQDCCQAHSGT